MSNSQKMIIVVARYNEDLAWLKKVPWEYIVFNKGKSLPKWVRNEIKLQNIGREGHSYLTYIIDNYENLPDYTIFVQGDPFAHSQELIKNINNFDGRADFFPLSDRICVNRYGDSSKLGLKIAESARKIFLNIDMEFFEFPQGAEFIVSKKAILFHSKMTYQKIMDFLIKTEPSDEKPSGYKVFSAKFPHGQEKLFRTKMTFQEVINSLKNKEYLVDGDNVNHGIFSCFVMEVLWQTLFDSKHKTLYD